MAGEQRLAAKYEATYPQTDIPEAQKAERQQRREFYAEYGQRDRPQRRTVGSIVVPALPWLEKEGEA